MGKPLLLIVDDDDDLRMLCQLCLQAHGAFEVVTASSGEEALAVAAREPLDLVLLDLCMPGMDGVTTLARLRAAPWGERLPVVLMTAAGEAPPIEHPAWAAVVFKPFDVRQLSEELERVLRRTATEEA